MSVGITRRRFLLASLAPLVAVCAPSGRRTTNKSGYCIDPHDRTQATVVAIADTVVPGPSSDPEGTPGAAEACVLNMFYDPYYGISSLIPVLISDIDSASNRLFGRDFSGLTFSQRTQVLLDREKNFPALLGLNVYSLVIAFCMLGFYGGIFNESGPDYAGFPGPSLGYRGVSSYGIRFSREMTQDGSLP